MPSYKKYLEVCSEIDGCVPVTEAQYARIVIIATVIGS